MTLSQFTITIVIHVLIFFRLELAVMNMIKKNDKAAKVMEVLHLIYKTYHYSPKSRRELKSIGNELDVRVRNPARVKGTRWSPHVEKALKIMLKPTADNAVGQYAIIFQHMEHLASTSKNSDVKGRAVNVVRNMKKIQFIAFAHFLLDLLGFITELSLALQSNKLILHTAVSAIKSCITSIEAIRGRPKPGGYHETFLCNVTQQQENGIQNKQF